MQSKNMWHDMAIIILCLWSPSPKHRHDLHRHQHNIMISIILIFINVSSHGRLASHNDKVKQLYGACILCNKETTMRLLPVADNFNKTWSPHTTHHVLTISHHNMPCKNKLDVLYFCYKFYEAATGWARTVLTCASKPQWYFVKLVLF